MASNKWPSNGHVCANGHITMSWLHQPQSECVLQCAPQCANGHVAPLSGLLMATERAFRVEAKVGWCLPMCCNALQCIATHCSWIMLLDRWAFFVVVSAASYIPRNTIQATEWPTWPFAHCGAHCNLVICLTSRLTQIRPLRLKNQATVHPAQHQSLTICLCVAMHCNTLQHTALKICCLRCVLRRTQTSHSE